MPTEAPFSRVFADTLGGYGINPNLTGIAGFDIDGTLSDNTHRLHLLNSGTWKEYYNESVNDTPIAPMIEIMRSLFYAGYRIYLFSGRYWFHRELLIKWFNDNTFVTHDVLVNSAKFYFRERPRNEICDAKTLKIRAMRERGFENISIYFDDDINVCKEVASFGIPTYRVTPRLFTEGDITFYNTNRTQDTTMEDRAVSHIASRMRDHASSDGVVHPMVTATATLSGVARRLS